MPIFCVRARYLRAWSAIVASMWVRSGAACWTMRCSANCISPPAPADSDAQLQRELGRLRRQRNLFVLALGAVLMVGVPPLIQRPLHELPRTQIIERTRHRHADVHKLLAADWTVSAIARRLNLDRKTVRRFRDTDLDQLLVSAHERRPAGVLEPFKPYLNTRFTESLGQVSGSRLFLEIRERGYRGSRQVVRKHLAALRAGNAEPVRADIPSPRKITGWIMRPQDTLPPDLARRLLDVRIACPDITRACDLARAFAELLRNRRGFLLTEWIRQAEQDAPKPISGFAGFLRGDLDAVTAGLTLHWSSGVVEGHVNRVKTLKRAMYGRASFTLLRTRVLTKA
ncbi:transposase [Streptomyces lavendulae]|uniref:transposase n=2 Tax=Streptomyces lavendulae TaxID=1914 RepID=UPI002554819F|nr:transposase [Streptomyces lavendulae]